MPTRPKSTESARSRDLAQAITAARTRAGVTQVEIAKRMGTTQTAIARLESGRVAPKTSTLQRFADAIQHRLVIGFEELNSPEIHAREKKGREP